MSGASLLASRHFLLKIRAFDECPCRDCHEAGAIKREMNNRKWFFVAVGYQCGFAYLIGLIVNNIGLLAQGVFSIWTVVAILVIIGMIYLLVRPYKESQTLKVGKTSVAASK